MIPVNNFLSQLEESATMSCQAGGEYIHDMQMYSQLR